MIRTAPSPVVRTERVRHTLTYAGLLAFTLMLYLRPNDLLPIGVFPIVRIVGFLTLVAFVVERPFARGFSVMPVEFKYLLGLTGLMLVGLPVALDPAEATSEFFTNFLKVVLIFMVMINAVNSLSRLRRLIAVTVVSGTIIALGTGYDYMRGANLVYGRATGFVGGMFGNPNDLALALNMLIPLAIALMLTARDPLVRLFYLGCAGCLFLAILLTFSRAGFLTLLVAGGFMLRTFVRRSGNAMALVILGVLALLALAPAGFWFRILTIFDPSGDANAAASASVRWEILGRSLYFATVNPKVWFLGVGMMNFHILSIGELAHHNAYLQIFNEIGVPAFILYLLFLFGALKTMGRIAVAHERVGQPTVAMLARGIQASLLAYAVGSFFASVAYLWYLYYAVGFAVCLRLLLDAGDPVDGPKRPGRGARLVEPRPR